MVGAGRVKGRQAGRRGDPEGDQVGWECAAEWGFCYKQSGEPTTGL